jgi:hypothetical protein
MKPNILQGGRKNDNNQLPSNEGHFMGLRQFRCQRRYSHLQLFWRNLFQLCSVEKVQWINEHYIVLLRIYGYCQN